MQTPGEGGCRGLTPTCVQPVSLQNAGQSRSDPSGSFSEIAEGDLAQNITVLCHCGGSAKKGSCSPCLGPGGNTDEPVLATVLKAGAEGTAAAWSTFSPGA